MDTVFDNMCSAKRDVLQMLNNIPSCKKDSGREVIGWLCRTAVQLRHISESYESTSTVALDDDGLSNDGRELLELTKAMLMAKLAFAERARQRVTEWAKRLLSANSEIHLFASYLHIIADAFERIAYTLWPHHLPVSCSLGPHNFPPQLPDLSDAFTRCRWSSLAEAACRVDLAGGWTDTPPITYECGRSAVLNVGVKVDGRRPIRCECRRLLTYTGVYICLGKLFGDDLHVIHYRKADDVFANVAVPSSPGSLICAILIASGLVEKCRSADDTPSRWRFNLSGHGRGILIQSESDLPHGSGLGTSSILSAAILASLWRLQQKLFTDVDLIQTVLQIEQLHTTGGGWQDQVGGVIGGGFKLATIDNESAGQMVRWRGLSVYPSFCHEFNERLVLIYTGTTRLAKNLLEKVVLRWLRGDEAIHSSADRLADGAFSAAGYIEKGEFPGQICAEYNGLKKVFVPDAEPPRVTRLRHALAAARIAEFSWMAGAGGGGYLYVWLARGQSIEDVRALIYSLMGSGSDNDSIGRAEGMHVSSVEIDFSPLHVD